MVRELATWSLLILAGAGLPSFAGAVQVQVKLPTPQKLDTTGMNRLLVGGFRASDNPSIDLDREVNKSLRDLLKRNTHFELIDAEALPMPEQSIEEAIRNTAYWKRLGVRFNADLVVGGTVDFSSKDQSGFVQEDVVSELTGQRMRRSRWVERESFRMEMGLYFFRGSSGDLLYEDHFTEEAAFDGKSNDQLSVLHQLFQRVSDSVLGVLIPRTRVETRYLFTE